jgi:hypothetical protein
MINWFWALALFSVAYLAWYCSLNPGDTTGAICIGTGVAIGSIIYDLTGGKK